MTDDDTFLFNENSFNERRIVFWFRLKRAVGHFLYYCAYGLAGAVLGIAAGFVVILWWGFIWRFSVLVLLFAAVMGFFYRSLEKTNENSNV